MRSARGLDGRAWLRSIDLFCGAGGLTRGLQQAGIETVAALEFDRSICASFAATFPNVELISADIREASFHDWRGRVEIVVGGPPCQPFSVAGRQLSSEDPRDCVPGFIRAVDECQPEAFVMENVPGLASPRHQHYLSAVMRQLGLLGYVVKPKVLNAADFGVPQFRKRLFLVGMRGRSFVFPEPTHGPGRELAHVSAGEALEGVPYDIPNTAKVTYAKKPVLRPQPWDGMMVNGGGRPINLTEPSQTIPASAGGNRTHILDPDGVLVEYHRYLMEGGTPLEGEVEGVRRLTVNESARLQSFPDEHVFTGKQSTRYRQVGNAVPPLLAQAVAESLMRQLLDEELPEEAVEPLWQDSLPAVF